MKQSESPKERINVTYSPASSAAAEDVEIPFKITVLGDFNPSAPKKIVEERKPIGVTKANFNDVIAAQNLGLAFTVKDHLGDAEDADFDVELTFGAITDFSPESVVSQIPETARLMALRDALVALKAPLGNKKEFRMAIEDIVGNPSIRPKLLEELKAEEEV